MMENVNITNELVKNHNSAVETVLLPIKRLLTGLEELCGLEYINDSMGFRMAEYGE